MVFQRLCLQSTVRGGDGWVEKVFLNKGWGGVELMRCI